jgi:DNA-binding response OmpR family regulator
MQREARGRMPRLRIFIVEDHVDSLDNLWIYLEESGHVVLSAQTKSKAHQQFSTADCDILISDIELRDGGGWDLVREPQALRPVYVIMISACGTRADRQKSTLAGFRYHLVKPVFPETLNTLLEDVAIQLGRLKIEGTLQAEGNPNAICAQETIPHPRRYSPSLYRPKGCIR